MTVSRSSALLGTSLGRRLLPALTTILLATNCLPSDTVVIHVTAATYNDKPVADELGANGTIGDPFYGPYLDGIANDPEGCVARGSCRESVSLLQPDLEAAGQEALVKSDCYWAPVQGEVLMATWEAVLTLDAPSAKLTCDSPTTVGTCRLRNPETGDPLKFHLEEPCASPSVPPMMLVTAAADAIPGGLNFPRQEEDYPYELDLPRDLDTPLATLGGATLPATFDDPYGRCPSPAEYTGPPPQPTLGSRCKQKDGLVSSCARRCGLLNPEEAVYRVSITGTSPDLTLSPALRIVPRAGRTIARPMTTDDGSVFRWQTSVEGGECGLDATGENPAPSKKYYRCRWHENFSPAVQIEALRIFALEGGTERPVDLAELVVRWKDPPDAGDVTEWRCPFDDGAGEAVIADFVDSCIRATPTYPVDSHANALSGDEPVPITAPIEWVVDFGADPPPAGDLHIEFALRNRTGQALLAVDPSVDLGRTRIGDRSSGTLWIRNVGDAEARIDEIALTGPEGGDFGYRVLATPLPGIEVPIEITVDAGGTPTAVVQRSALELLPLVEWVDRSITPRLRLRDPLRLATAPEARSGAAAAAGPALGPGAPVTDPTRVRPGASAADPATAQPRISPTEPAAETPSGRLATPPARPARAPAAASPGTPAVASPDSPAVASPGTPTVALPAAPVLVTRTKGALANLKLPPFTIAPGEAVEVAVDMTPSAYGRRRADLRFEGVDADRPTRAVRVISVLHGWGLGGPILHTLPDGVLELPYPLTPRSPERPLLLINSGDMPARRTGIAITGRDAARFTVASDHDSLREIEPGDSEHFVIRLTSPCAPMVAGSPAHGGPTVGQAWEAVLELTTDEGVVAVPLRGRSIDCFRRR